MDEKTQAKVKKLNIASSIFGVLWLVGVFVLHYSGYVHLLLAVAVLLTIMRIAQNPVR